MAILSNAIESFIKDMLKDEMPALELKRNEIAARFGCAPSQINYVLQTRFTPEHGYIVESRRGGGGCIRVVRVRTDAKCVMDVLVEDKFERSGLTETQARSIIASLLEAGIASRGEAAVMAGAVSERTLGAAPEKDRLRLDIMRSMTAELLKGDR